jgi:hypothetical protein
VAALVLAAVLGSAGGITTALWSGVDPQDPLGLGVPLENLPCTGQTVIIVGEGESSPALSHSVADWDGVRYLETAKSCPTVYPLVRGELPTYVAYLPPYASAKGACEDRMTAQHRGDFTTRLIEGNVDSVNCACELDVATLPEFGEGQPPTTVSGMWVNLYQNMLDDLGVLELRQVQPGIFDEEMIRITREFQTDGGVSPTAIADEDTWRLLRDKACDRYRY